MKTTIFKTLFIALPIAASLAACGKSTATGTASTAASTTASTVSAVNNAIGTSTGTGSTGNTSPTGCSHPYSTYTTPFTYTLSGTGNVSAQTTGSFGNMDQDLRVRVTPASGGINQYGKMSVDVTLIRDGSAVSGSTVRLPGTTNSQGQKNGLAVGTPSAIADFSRFILSGSHTYSVKVDNVMTDYTCNMYCTTTNPMYQSWQWNGYTYVYGPDMTMINACKQLQCEVGPVTSGRTWSVSVQVETDNTPCLQ